MHLALITIKFSETKRLLLIYLIRVTTFFMFAVYFFSLFYLEENRGFTSGPNKRSTMAPAFLVRIDGDTTKVENIATAQGDWIYDKKSKAQVNDCQEHPWRPFKRQTNRP